MGFGSILDVFKADNWSNEIVGRIGKMLAIGHEMYAFAIRSLLEGEMDGDPQARIYDRDKKINKIERKIRRRVVERLSLRGSRADIPTALIFMNAVKDGERIGDYVKNLHEVGGMMPKDVDRALYRERLGQISADIGTMFEHTREAFENSDEALAGQVIKTAKASGRKYEALIREITASDLATPDAVCMVLMLRFYKRLVAHMGNIASTVVMPVDLIDYYDEDDE
jgi:phosphate transport system protein